MYGFCSVFLCILTFSAVFRIFLPPSIVPHVCLLCFCTTCVRYRPSPHVLYSARLAISQQTVSTGLWLSSQGSLRMSPVCVQPHLATGAEAAGNPSPPTTLKKIALVFEKKDTKTGWIMPRCSKKFTNSFPYLALFSNANKTCLSIPSRMSELFTPCFLNEVLK